jgi:hypothetical protein
MAIFTPSKSFGAQAQSKPDFQSFQPHSRCPSLLQLRSEVSITWSKFPNGYPLSVTAQSLIVQRGIASRFSVQLQAAAKETQKNFGDQLFLCRTTSMSHQSCAGPPFVVKQNFSLILPDCMPRLCSATAPYNIISYSTFLFFKIKNRDFLYEKFIYLTFTFLSELESLDNIVSVLFSA